MNTMSSDIEDPMGSYPEYRNNLNRRLKNKLKQVGHQDSGNPANKQLLTDSEFYKEFIVKMRCLKDIQDEEDGRKN